MSSTRTFQDVYAGIGFLFYSIAASDGRIAPAEKRKLQEQVDKHWLSVEDSHDQFGTDSAHYIDISFDYAITEEMSAEDAYLRFTDQYKSRPQVFDKAMKALVVKTATGIADSFYGTSHVEHERLARLKKLFHG